MDPNREELLKDLKKVEYWNRGDFISAAGWATMPGDNTADREVADKLAIHLMKLY
jgi:hypothetical protein